ncbi:MAG: glycosyltransferase family 2 protein [Halioglobus sp.]
MSVSHQTACVVLNWRNTEATVKCISSILEGDVKPKYIYVVDNHSMNNANLEIGACLEQTYPQFEENFGCQFIWVDTLRNLGYAGGNNVALVQAMQIPEVEYLWILNNDTQVAGRSLEAMLELAGTCSDVGFVGGRVKAELAGSEEYSGGGRVYPRLGLTRRVKSVASEHEYQGIDYVVGCNMLIKCSMARKVGLMDESYFMYSEEVDWQLEAKKRGWRAGIALDCVVSHGDGLPSASYYYYKNRAAILLARKCGGVGWALLSFFVHLVIVLVDKPSPRGVWKAYKGCLDGVLGVTGFSSNAR